METIRELTEQEAHSFFIIDGEKCDLSEAFEMGFDNEFDQEGRPEDYCVLDMDEADAREYVVNNTKWMLAEQDGEYFLIGENEISGFGYSENKIDLVPSKYIVGIL